MLYTGVQGCIEVYMVVYGFTVLYRGLQGCIGSTWLIGVKMVI